jgi:hypothetical protein
MPPRQLQSQGGEEDRMATYLLIVVLGTRVSRQFVNSIEDVRAPYECF